MKSRTWLALLAATLFAGCSESGPERPETVTANGKVTYNGEPIEGATVTFVPQEGEHAAVGITDAAGKFSLTTFTHGDGAVPGKYRVKVTKFEQTEPPPDAGSTGASDKMPVMSPNFQPPEPESLLPSQYADPSSSGFSATVSESPEENIYDLKLTD